MEFYSESDVFKIQYVVSFEIQGISRSLVLRIRYFLRSVLTQSLLRYMHWTLYLDALPKSKPGDY